MSDRTRSVIEFVVSFTIFLMVWHYSISFFNVPTYFLPSPWAVGQSLWTGLVGGIFYTHIAATLQAMIIGYVAGCLAGLLLAIVFVEFPVVERVTNPYLLAVQAMPKVALAPLVVIWFGYGLEAKIVMVALICFFPVFVNALIGMRATNPDLISLFDAFSASRTSKIINLKLPAAAGAIFAGLQVAVVFALIGTVFTEFVAARAGLGVLISAAMSTFDVATMFAGILILSVFGVLFSGLVNAAHRKLVFWEGARR